ncbi:hypothetical protein JN11_03646 [Mucilaginibacter frigoritolerans]|uniref:Uncharacterized protein n=1 Tax=Mucilaginibacter frigoritolerans TaxID=652788 RepID=A0A562TUG2_9SPHI|nr:hypothetical protein JN11_03646 [Mucilaginibacter frigoritolerans]
MFYLSNFYTNYSLSEFMYAENVIVLTAFFIIINLKIGPVVLWTKMEFKLMVMFLLKKG